MGGKNENDKVATLKVYPFTINFLFKSGFIHRTQKEITSQTDYYLVILLV